MDRSIILDVQPKSRWAAWLSSVSSSSVQMALSTQIARSFIVLCFLAEGSGSTRPAAAPLIPLHGLFLHIFAGMSSGECLKAVFSFQVCLFETRVRFELNPVDLSSELALPVSTDTKFGRDKPVCFCCSLFFVSLSVPCPAECRCRWGSAASCPVL